MHLPRLPLALPSALSLALGVAEFTAAADLELGLFATGEASVVAEGIDPGLDGRGFAEFTARWSPAGATGPAIFGTLWWQEGPLLVERVGDFQFASNIDAPDMLRLAELGVDHRAGGAQFRAGKFDANGLLSVTHSNMAYMHSALAFSPTLVALPTFPVPALGVAAGLPLGPGRRAQLVVQDGDAPDRDGLGASFDARFYGLELEGQAPGGTGVALGGWWHDGEWSGREGIGGMWAQLDAPVAGHREGDHVDLFAMAGWTPFEEAVATRHVALALLDEARVIARPGDLAGVAASALWLEGLDGPELALELFYEAWLAPWIAVRPALQWVHAPDLAPGREDAPLAFVRLTVVR